MCNTDGKNMTSTAQIDSIRAEIASDISESAYQCELEYHLDYLLTEMDKVSEVSEDEEELVFA
jgi:hypothetical protein